MAPPVPAGRLSLPSGSWGSTFTFVSMDDFFVFLSLFIFERDRDSVSGGGAESERERKERISSRLCAESRVQTYEP